MPVPQLPLQSLLYASGSHSWDTLHGFGREPGSSGMPAAELSCCCSGCFGSHPLRELLWGDIAAPSTWVRPGVDTSGQDLVSPPQGPLCLQIESFQLAIGQKRPLAHSSAVVDTHCKGPCSSGPQGPKQDSFSNPVLPGSVESSLQGSSEWGCPLHCSAQLF